MQTTQQQTTVPIPPGSAPNTQFSAMLPNGQMMTLMVPPDYVDYGIQQGVPVMYQSVGTVAELPTAVSMPHKIEC